MSHCGVSKVVDEMKRFSLDLSDKKRKKNIHVLFLNCLEGIHGIDF